jgi:tetratricopeptide (TPR) repeat protein
MLEAADASAGPRNSPVTEPSNVGTTASIEPLLSRLHLQGSAADAQRVLADVTVRSAVIEEFRPIADSLEWKLGELYWSREGVAPFVRNEVPYLVNNDGLASENAAVLLFAACRDAANLPSRIAVLELGGGLGLFARLFLESFARLCRQEGADYYDRLVYVASDGSRRTVERWREAGLFAGHEAHVVLGVCDGTRPSRIDSLAATPIPETWQAVICNYVLDVLPAAVVRRSATGYEQLCVRTRLLDDPTLVTQYTAAQPHEIQALATSDDPDTRHGLIPLMTVLDLESAFMPVAAPGLPYAEESLALMPDRQCFVVNHGAVASLETLRDLLASDGFILVNDYGPVHPEQVAAQSVPQRFGPTTAIGLNFPLLEALLTRRGFHIAAPSGDETRAIHARLLSRRELPGVRQAFEGRFGSEAWSYLDTPMQEARACAAAGRRQEALEKYQTALSRQPRNWQIIGEAAEFVGLQLREFAAGVELARTALEFNPCYSSWLWNVLGDCLYCLQRVDDAHQAYLQAERIDATDPRALLNLAYTYHHLGHFETALEAVARGLSRDGLGQYRERLLERQQQILVALSARLNGEQDRLLRRAARLQQGIAG